MLKLNRSGARKNTLTSWLRVEGGETSGEQLRSEEKHLKKKENIINNQHRDFGSGGFVHVRDPGEHPAERQ